MNYKSSPSIQRRTICIISSNTPHYKWWNSCLSISFAAATICTRSRFEHTRIVTIPLMYKHSIGWQNIATGSIPSLLASSWIQSTNNNTLSVGLHAISSYRFIRCNFLANILLKWFHRYFSRCRWKKETRNGKWRQTRSTLEGVLCVARLGSS